MNINRRKLLTGLLTAPIIVPALSMFKGIRAVYSQHNYKYLSNPVISEPTSIPRYFFNYNFVAYDNYICEDFTLACTHILDQAHLDDQTYPWNRELYGSLRVSLQSHIKNDANKLHPEPKHRIENMYKILDEIGWLKREDGTIWASPFTTVAPDVHKQFNIKV